MKVKVKDTWYDADEELLLVWLTRSERELINNMPPEAKGKLCVGPDNIPHDKIRKWMNT